MDRYIKRIQQINAKDIKLMLLVNAEVKKYNSIYITAFWTGLSEADNTTCIRVTRRCDPSDRMNPKNVNFFNMLKVLAKDEGYIGNLAVIPYTKEKNEEYAENTENMSEIIINTVGALEILTINLKTVCNMSGGYLLSHILNAPKLDITDHVNSVSVDTSQPIIDNRAAEVLLERFHASG